MSSKAVNVPTNQKIKEQDINGKLQLYGIYSAFANGKVPSNKQIDVALNTALDWTQFKTPSGKLSTEGQQLTRDLRDVIEKAKVLILTKNSGNVLQDFIWQTQKIGANNVALPGAPIDKDTAQQHGQQALAGLRTLGELLITNGEFRKLLSDASLLLRDIAGDAAQKTADQVNPSEDDLAKLDEAAPDNTWHEAPNLSKDNIKQQIQAKIPIGKKDVDEVVGNATQAASGTRDPTKATNQAADEVQRTGDAPSNIDAQAGVQQAAQDIKKKVNSSIPEDHKEKAREYRRKTNDYFKTKFPKERQDQLIYRLKKMVVEIQGHQDYQQAIDTILRLAEEYTGHTKTVVVQSTETVKGVHSQDSLTIAENELKTLLERFANSTSFDDVIEAINQIYRDADQDPELKGWFKDIDAYVRRCLKEQGFILQDESNTQWDKLYEHGHFLLRERYRAHTNHVVDEFKFIGQQFDADPQNKAFGAAVNKLFLDLGNDENGKPTFKPHLIKDLTDVIIPGFFENVRYVPIPRIEYSDPMVDAVIENLVIEGDNLAPNVLEFGSDNYWRWGRKGNSSKNKNKVMLAVSGVQMDLKDVSYYIKKKQGFPGITDKGVMDIFLGGTGFSFKVGMETADATDRQHFFRINTINVDIKHLSIKLKQSNHKLLFNVFKPLLLKVMRPIIQKVAEKQIRDYVTQADAFIYKIKTEADRAIEEAKSNPDPENLENIYQRYFSAFQRELQQAKEKKEEIKAKSAETTVNVAITQHDSIFKNISLPGGVSTKATEYRDLAAKGDKWESPVFSIGSASETTSLPAVSTPSRKPHQTTQPGLIPKGGSAPIPSTTTTNGNFATQVDSAFTGSAAPTTGTTLGSSNPVLQGSV